MVPAISTKFLETKDPRSGKKGNSQFPKFESWTRNKQIQHVIAQNFTNFRKAGENGSNLLGTDVSVIASDNRLLSVTGFSPGLRFNAGSDKQLFC
jgi:hypothetical protein